MAALLAILVLVGLAAVSLLWPLRHRPRGDYEPAADASRDLGRTIKLQELADLELDYRLGKLDEEDYRRLRDELRAEAVDLLIAPDSRSLGLADSGHGTAGR